MEAMIETGVDKLMALVQEKKKISVKDAAKQLGLSAQVIEEWMNFLEEEGLISVEYRFTKPYLIEKRLTPQEIAEKAKAFQREKETFIRKTEATVSVLEREGEELDRMKKEVGTLRLEGAKELAGDLEKSDSSGQKSIKQMNAREKAFQRHLELIDKEVQKEREKYEHLISEAKEEEEKLTKQLLESESIDTRERGLRARLEAMKAEIDELKKRAISQEEAVGITTQRLSQLRKKISEFESQLDTRKSKAVKALEKRQVHALESQRIEGGLLARLRNPRMFKRLLRKRRDILDLVGKLDKEKDELEKELQILVKKARAYEVSKSQIPKGRLQELEQSFQKISKKKEELERNALQMRSVFKE